MPTTAPASVHRRALRSAAVLGAAALATGSLAACGSSSDDAGATPGESSGASSAVAKASPAELLRGAVPATTAKGSYHLRVRATVAEDGRPVTINVDGDQASSPTRASFEITAPSLGSALGEADVRYRSGKLYARTSKAPGWYAIDVARFQERLGPLGGSFTSSPDPKVLVTALERKGGVQDAGSADVDGTSTRHLRGTVTSRDLAAAGTPEQRRSFEQLESLAKGSAEVRRTLDAPIALDFYVQEDGALRRIAFSGTLSGDRFQAQADLTDFGEDVDVQAPPASQTQELTPDSIGKLLMAG